MTFWSRRGVRKVSARACTAAHTWASVDNAAATPSARGSRSRRLVAEKSRLGGWRYEVLDTKLALKTKAKFLIQLACYSDLVAAA